MIDVAGIALRRHGHGRAGQAAAVLGRERAALVRPARQPGEPRAQDRGLHLVEPRVDAELAVMVAIGLAAVAQPRRRAASVRRPPS